MQTWRVRRIPRVARIQLLSLEAALKVLGANGMLLLHWVPLYHTALRRVNGFASVVYRRCKRTAKMTYSGLGLAKRVYA